MENLKKHRKIIIGIAIVIVLVAAIFLGTSKMRAYLSAQKSVEKGDYLTAISILEGLKGYKDSDSLLEESWYGAAGNYAQEKKYEEALNALDNIANLENIPNAVSLQTSCKYELGKLEMESKDFAKAHELFNSILNYSDVQSLDKECLHMIDVQNDKEPPVILGIEENIDILCGTEFNIKDYLKDLITISDNVSENIVDYTISCDSKLYDKGSGEVDTTTLKNLTFEISTKDEAGNEGIREMTVSLKPIHVTKENPHPVVYDGKYATITLSSFKHGEFYGEMEYQFIFEVKNKMEKSLIVYLPNTTSINDYQVGAYYVVSQIAPGKTGKMESSISDSDIPDSITDFNQIDSDVCLMEAGSDKAFYGIPIVFDTNAIE